MKKLFIAAALVITVIPQTQAQNWKDALKNVVNGATGNNGNGSSLGSLSNTDIVAGLRQALEIGAQNASSRLNVVNGFFGNALIKVLMPPEAKKVENTLRSIGMGSTVDKAILAMNRA